jgi:hypothetical protein
MQQQYTITAVIMSIKPPPALAPIIIHFLFTQPNDVQLSASSAMVVVFVFGGISVNPLFVSLVGVGGTTGPVFKAMLGLKIRA